MINLSECTLSNIAGLTRNPVSYSLPTNPWLPNWSCRQTPEHIAITVAQRLAHLIYRLETQQLWNTAIGAKWYLQHITSIPIADYQSIIQPFVDRLTNSLHLFEEKYGEVDATIFDKMVEFGGVPRQRILYGLIIGFMGREVSGSPFFELSFYINSAMWKQHNI